MNRSQFGHIFATSLLPLGKTLPSSGSLRVKELAIQGSRQLKPANVTQLDHACPYVCGAVTDLGNHAYGIGSMMAVTGHV